MHERTGKTALARRDGGALLDRLLDTPRVAAMVPRLPPETLHAAIEQSGIEACGALLALATPEQVARVLDLDLWRRPEAGRDERFDADRFGLWLEVLVEQGVEIAAALVARLDVDLVAAGLAQHVRIFDIATLEAYETTDGTEIPAVIERDGGLGCDIAGRRLMPRRTDAWDAITEVLAELAASHVEAFVPLMRACATLSNSRREVDGLDDLLSGAGQAMFDLADARAQRREARGFAAPASARAFLESSRRVRPGPPALAPETAGGRASTAMISGPTDARRQEELAWLANVLIAGCSIGGRAFTPQEAADAVVATCRLGIDSWPRQAGGGPVGEDLLVDHDLVPLFQVGWTVLHDEVCVRAASALLDVLAGLPRYDPETQAGLDELRATLLRDLRAGVPWRSRDAMDVLATLDLPAWTTLLALIAECPVLPAAIDPAAPKGRRTIDASAFTCIADRRQLAAVDGFLAALPSALRG